MGQISTPPRPASRNCVSSRVRLAASTALPNHHQRVQGRHSRVTAGQLKASFLGGASAAATHEAPAASVRVNSVGFSIVMSGLRS